MYKIIYLEEVSSDIKIIPNNMQKIIRGAIETRIMIDPYSYGKPLRYSWKGHRRLRVGDYRVIYKIIEEEQKITVIAIKHRKEVYEC